MNTYSRHALNRAKEDIVFARILTATNPRKALEILENESWIQLTASLKTTTWLSAVMDLKRGVIKSPQDYSEDPIEIMEIEAVQSHIQRFREYTILLAGNESTPLSDYLNGITIDDFRSLMQGLEGLDAAREIQRLYKEGVIDYDLGGSKLHRFMEQLNLPYIPTVNHLNAARRGEIAPGRYNMSKSRTKGLK